MQLEMKLIDLEEVYSAEWERTFIVTSYFSQLSQVNPHILYPSRYSERELIVIDVYIDSYKRADRSS